MIADTIKNISLYKGINENLDKAILHIMEVELAGLPNGKTIIDGEDVFVNVMEAKLLPEKDGRFEFHHKYADLQIDIEGAECWKYAEDAKIIEEYSEESDIGFAEGTASCSGKLGDGRFVLFFPGEYHMPGVESVECNFVRKTVYKIRM